MATDTVDQVRERLDIVDLIGQQVNLRKAGRNFKGLCPFHQEKTPSFIVFPDSQTFHCFGCGAGGDAFNYLMQLEHLDFRGALEQLAARTGVELKPAGPPPEPEEVERNQRLFEINSRAANWFSHVLWQTRFGTAGRDVLERRGVDRATAERFQLGYAPDSWDALLNHFRERGISEAETVAAGLAIEREGGGCYDRFRDRLIYPIQDKDGRVIGFGGRAIGDVQPKYLNTPQTVIFDKGANLYALHLAQDAIRRTREVVVVEGYMDAIAAHQFGFENVVASMGTALTSDQVRLVRRSVDRILLALDSDAAGQMATLRGLDVLREGLAEADRPTADAAGLVRFERTLRTDIRIVKLPSGKDPDELIRKDVEAWRTAVASPVPFIDFYIDTVIGPARSIEPREKSEVGAEARSGIAGDRGSHRPGTLCVGGRATTAGERKLDSSDVTRAPVVPASSYASRRSSSDRESCQTLKRSSSRYCCATRSYSPRPSHRSPRTRSLTPGASRSCER